MRGAGLFRTVFGKTLGFRNFCSSWFICERNQLQLFVSSYVNYTLVYEYGRSKRGGVLIDRHVAKRVPNIGERR